MREAVLILKNGDRLGNEFGGADLCPAFRGEHTDPASFDPCEHYERMMPEHMERRPTGGGCEAWSMRGLDFEIWITDDDGSSVPCMCDTHFIVGIIALNENGIYENRASWWLEASPRPLRSDDAGGYYFHTDDLTEALNWTLDLEAWLTDYWGVIE